MTQMPAILLTLSLISFILFLAPLDFRKYLAAAGWFFLGIFFFGTSIAYLSENEFVYPFIALLSLPVLAITIKSCIREEKTAFQITMVAAIAFLIYSLTAFIEPVSEWMIASQVENTVLALSAIGHPASVSAWDTIISNGYIIIITISCTPVVGTAVMLGVAAGVGGTTRQKVMASVFAVLALAILNIIRLIFVVVAYSDQWFPYFFDIASNGYPGYESFYWAHNVIGRISFTLLGILIVGGGLVVFIPSIREFYSDILYFYYRGLKKMAEPLLKIFKSD